ncbi:hypothetical protein HA402_002332 [Bradysia odoriphaga]|nr:hypothetical protein HA402_002332 [Bradysia odoriphaga]
MNRKKNLNPVFHLQNKKEDEGQLSKGMIKIARKSGCLNMSGRALASVPLKVWHINEPDKEDLDVNFAKEDKSEENEWWNQKTLNNLDLSSNVITSISSEIGCLQDLEILNLRDNALQSLPNEIGQLRKLIKINLSHNKLTKLPKTFFDLVDLRQLTMSHNQFSEMEPELNNLLMLEELDLSHNELTSIPEGIGFLVRISKLSLSHNKLKILPDDIVNIRRLNTLDVMNNDLEQLPSQMGELRKLEFLYAQHNDIVELPVCNGCESLKEIHISNNFIKEIPPDFCQNLPQLKVLDLRDNKIEKLCSEIAYLQSIMRLDLSNNSINSLPSSLSTLSHLVSLQLDGNPIRSIRRDIIQGGTIRILKLLRDRFSQEEHADEAKSSVPTIGAENKTFPDRFQMRKARSLAISGKNLKDIPDSVFLTAQEESIDKVDLSKNKLPAFPDGLSYLEAFLSEIDMSNNCISSVPAFMSQFTRISYCNVANNSIADLPKEFGLLDTLRELNISYNKLTKIPDCVYELRSLEILLARDNKIEKIDVSATGLAAIPKLATLDLANNNIDHVPPELGLLKKILVLEIGGNKFRQPRQQILEKGTDTIMSYLRDRIPQ